MGIPNHDSGCADWQNRFYIHQNGYQMDNRFKITYKRGHGPGGQHKNKVETCCVVTDPVTGFTETCQDTRSQAQNRSLAVDRLVKRKHQKENDLRKEAGLKGVIRTYNFSRNEVKDHRTGIKANLKKVLNGALNLIR